MPLAPGPVSRRQEGSGSIASATLLLAQGVHPKIVQERLGHADISMTLHRYSHVTPDMQRQAADTLDAVFTKVS